MNLVLMTGDMGQGVYERKTDMKAIVSLGSNLEPRADYLKRAIAALSSLPETCFVKAS